MRLGFSFYETQWSRIRLWITQWSRDSYSQNTSRFAHAACTCIFDGTRCWKGTRAYRVCTGTCRFKDAKLWRTDGQPVNKWWTIHEHVMKKWWTSYEHMLKHLWTPYEQMMDNVCTNDAFDRAIQLFDGTICGTESHFCNIQSLVQRSRVYAALMMRNYEELMNTL